MENIFNLGIIKSNTPELRDIFTPTEAITQEVKEHPRVVSINDLLNTAEEDVYTTPLSKRISVQGEIQPKKVQKLASEEASLILPKAIDINSVEKCYKQMHNLVSRLTALSCTYPLSNDANYNTAIHECMMELLDFKEQYSNIAKKLIEQISQIKGEIVILKMQIIKAAQNSSLGELQSLEEQERAWLEAHASILKELPSPSQIYHLLGLVKNAIRCIPDSSAKRSEFSAIYFVALSSIGESLIPTDILFDPTLLQTKELTKRTITTDYINACKQKNLGEIVKNLSIAVNYNLFYDHLLSKWEKTFLLPFDINPLVKPISNLNISGNDVALEQAWCELKPLLFIMDMHKTAQNKLRNIQIN